MKTDKMILRKFTINDADKMYENWASDSRVTKFLTWKPHTSLKESEKIIKQWINDDKNVYFAICNTNNENIGCISASLIKENPITYAIGYCLAYDYWLQGIMTESLKIMLKYLFEEKNAVRVEATHDRRNSASGKVMMNANMKYEGCLRKSATNNQ
ncbi:GNAT family N-acetyltransferase, partial [Finegoldia magna]